MAEGVDGLGDSNELRAMLELKLEYIAVMLDQVHHKELTMHPVKRALLSHVSTSGGNTIVESTVLEHGRPFIGMKRPKNYRPRAIKECFANAGNLACEERGIYVEGFVIVPLIGGLTHHAWITVDGLYAIDVTLRSHIPDCLYFGIPFSLEVLRQAISSRGKYRLIDAIYGKDGINKLLENNRLHPPPFP